MFGIEIRKIAGTRNGYEIVGYGRTYGPFPHYIVDRRMEKAWF